MKKLNFISILIAVLAWSCAKDDMLNMSPNADQLSVNASLKVSGAVIKVSPGSNDTKALTDAFAQAQTFGKNAVVKLMPGTFTIGMIEIREFSGTFCGSGMGKTIITNSPDLTPDAVIAQNKVPALITFIGGDISVSDLTVKMPEALSWLGTQEMNMLLFSDYSADFTPAKKLIEVNLNNIELTGVLQKDVTMEDGTVIDYPYSLFNGVKLGPDIMQSSGSLLKPRSSIDATVSNSEFSNFGVGFQLYGCKSCNFNFGAKGGNILSGNNQGLAMSENIGVKAEIIHNEFNIPAYNWDGLDINTMETMTFESVQEDLGTYDIRDNVFNTHFSAEGFGVWDAWRYEHPENPVWMNMLWDHNTLNNLEDNAWVGMAIAMKNFVFLNNKIVGNALNGGFYNMGDSWITDTSDPNYWLTWSENCKIINNFFLQKNFQLIMDWDTKNYLVNGDLSNVIISDLGVNNTIIQIKTRGHGLSKYDMNRMGKIRDMYYWKHDHNRH